VSFATICKSTNFTVLTCLGRIILKWITEKKDGIRIWTSGGILRTFGFHKMLVIY
jgi:hypothetical protein